jgi:hypothetical protein
MLAAELTKLDSAKLALVVKRKPHGKLCGQRRRVVSELTNMLHRGCAQVAVA